MSGGIGLRPRPAHRAGQPRAGRPARRCATSDEKVVRDLLVKHRAVDRLRRRRTAARRLGRTPQPVHPGHAAGLPARPRRAGRRPRPRASTPTAPRCGSGSWRPPVADPKGFLHDPRARAAARGARCRSGCMDWNEVYEEQDGRAAAAPGRPLHGLRHPVLPPRLSAGQPHPGVERPGLARATGARRSSGCTRPTTSPSSPAGCARRRARRRACSASTSRPVTIKQVEVTIDRPRVRRGAGSRRSRRSG